MFGAAALAKSEFDSGDAQRASFDQELAAQYHFYQPGYYG